MKFASYHNFFRNFANKTRLSIILCLSQKQRSVGELAQCVGEEQSKISHHLSGLANCGILLVERKGKQRIYSLNKKSVEPLLKAADVHIKGCNKGCCKNEKCCLSG